MRVCVCVEHAALLLPFCESAHMRHTTVTLLNMRVHVWVFFFYDDDDWYIPFPFHTVIVHERLVDIFVVVLISSNVLLLLSYSIYVYKWHKHNDKYCAHNSCVIIDQLFSTHLKLIWYQLELHHVLENGSDLNGSISSPYSVHQSWIYRVPLFFPTTHPLLW